MSSMGSRLPRGVFAALLAVTATFLWSGTACAQRGDGSDLLDQARKLKEVAAQKLEAEVRDALRQAQTLEPAKAAVVLRHTMTTLEQDTALSPERRDSLKQLVRTRLRAVDGSADKPDPGRVITDANRRAEEQARAQEQQQIDRSMATIRYLQGQGKFAEADRAARELARQYPNNPAAAAASRITPAIDRAVDLQHLRTEKERRFGGAMTQAEIAALPPISDREFPADWRERSARRAKLTNRMTEKEKAIVDALNSPVSVDFKQSPFEEVIKELERVTGQTIFLDKQSLDEAQVRYETPVNLQLKKVTFRTALRKMLGDLGLTYIVKDQTIQVMTPAKAKDTLTTQTYYVGDLLFVAGFVLPPGLSQLQAAQTMAQLVDLIQRTIDPSSWQVNGGPGTITFYAPTMSLVIRQSAEMHLILGSGIGGYQR